ncbi:MAG: LD-carboxypeptidase [Gammaproteobacteria bacterium]|nr:LD-carboxypeptidase [Gammaproteobacteria bacterium]
MRLTDRAIRRQPIGKLMRRPTIGILAPASKPSEQALCDTRTLLHARGYGTRLLGLDQAHLARTNAGDRLRAARLHEAFTDPDIDLVLCVRGGYGSGRIVDLLDFDLIARHPKPLVGYSDVTYLLFALYHQAGLASIHGPCGAELSGLREPHAVRALFDVLHGRCTGYRLNHAQCRPLRVGHAVGPLLGGNLTILSSMMGTACGRIPEGAILFLEDVNEYLYQQDRALTHLRRCGILERASAIIVGRTPVKDPSGEVNSLGHSFTCMLQDRLADLEVPIVSEFPCGHTRDQLSLPFGALSQLQVSAHEVRLDFANPFANRDCTAATTMPTVSSGVE